MCVYGTEIALHHYFLSGKCSFLPLALPCTACGFMYLCVIVLTSSFSLSLSLCRASLCHHSVCPWASSYPSPGNVCKCTACSHTSFALALTNRTHPSKGLFHTSCVCGAWGTYARHCWCITGYSIRCKFVQHACLLGSRSIITVHCRSLGFCSMLFNYHLS